MHRTADGTDDFEPAASITSSAFAPDALVVVGSLGLTMATLIVGCHLYRIFIRQSSAPVFGADDRLILAYFYAVITIFVIMAVF
ncbi:MAG: hypothetical protein ACEQR8_03575 [Cypionkella sp.]